MNQSLRHRGPDDEGLFLFQNKEYSLGLGHVRLAILDLSPRGHQPMGLSENGKIIYKDDELKNANYVIVFNGEIYNYLELKNKFKLMTETDTDTEIILRLYHLLGPSCVEEFNGMWAFALFDREKNLLFCSRDRLGVKPFYYYWDNKRFIFSSELKGILPVKAINNSSNLNREAVELYFSLGFIPSPLTIYQNTYKLEAAHNLYLDLSNAHLQKKAFWELPDYNPLYERRRLIEEGRSLLFDAVRLRMRSDVPVGAFLSGGLDSSSVVSAMRKFTDLSRLHTFSIGFEGRYDESPYIKQVVKAFNTKHHHKYFREDDLIRLLPVFPEVYDEPFGDYSGFPTYEVSDLARRFVTVSLSGDGGDEVFGGYTNHLNGARIDFIRRWPRMIRYLLGHFPARKNLNSAANLYLLKEAFKLSLKSPEEFLSASLEEDALRPPVFKEWTQEKVKYCLRKGGDSLAEALRIFDLLYNTLADNFLVKVDRASMAHALEVRSPFLDYRFAEFSQRIPTPWKVNLRRTKILMREIISGLVPEEIVKRGKWGFTPPLDRWILKRGYLEKLKQFLTLVKEISPYIFSFYKNKVFSDPTPSLYRNYLIRLFLFGLWWERWIIP